MPARTLLQTVPIHPELLLNLALPPTRLFCCWSALPILEFCLICGKGRRALCLHDFWVDCRRELYLQTRTVWLGTFGMLNVFSMCVHTCKLNFTCARELLALSDGVHAHNMLQIVTVMYVMFLAFIDPLPPADTLWLVCWLFLQNFCIPLKDRKYPLKMHGDKYMNKKVGTAVPKSTQIRVGMM